MSSIDSKNEADKKHNRLFFRIFLPLTLVIALVVSLWPANGVLLFILLSIYFVFILAFFNNKWGLFLFVILRPALDFSTKETIIKLGGFDLNFAAILGIVILIFTAWILISKHKAIKSKTLLSLWVVFLAVNFLSLFFSFSFSASLAELARLLTIFSMFLLGFMLIENNHDLTKLIKVIIFSSLVPAFSALWQLINGSGLKDANDLRVYGTFAHPNMLAFFLCLSIVLTVFIFLNNNRRKISSMLYTLLMILELILLIFTYTRGAWLVLGIFIIIIGLLHFRKFLAISIVVFSLLYLVVTPFQMRVNSLITPDPYGSINWRLELWSDAYSYMKNKPVLGHGLGTASLVIADKRGPKLGSPEPHNDYLRLGLDAGFLGVTSYLLLVISLLVNLAKRYAWQQRPRLKMFNLFMLSFVLALSVMSFGDNVLNDTALQWSIWVLAGALIALQVKLKKAIPA